MAGSGGGGGTQTSTQTVNTGPWQPQQSYLTSVFDQAANLNRNPTSQYYPGQTVAGFDPAQTQGYQQVIDKGLAGSPLMPAANKTALDTINGSYLDPSTNPWLQKTYDAAAGDVTRNYQTATAPNTDAAMAMAGRYGSGAYGNLREGNERTLGNTLERLGTDLYGGNYARERQNQLGMTNNVGNLIQASYLDPTAAINAGAARQQQQQREMAAAVEKYNYNRDAPWMDLARYKAMIDGNYGQYGMTTMTTPIPQGNTAGMAMGGLLGAGSVAGQLGWSPFSSGGGGAGAAAGGIGNSLGGSLASGAGGAGGSAGFGSIAELLASMGSAAA